ncbi:uncharacterized protein BJX67DRAFT_346895 [Aspergillus lucknowensis]|uniref:Inner centromere protein ARK-binding domain-containing protein n=1 Tax=Aspergillus lucknowensis TaxID=176173 RepID=A0ABR4LYY7_9EURO
MAGAAARAQKPVGSAAWISTEKENSMQLVNQELEEIEFPVRFEMEWLNEHMAEVFSNNQFSFTEVFKTPGKLRGKTPRTLRKPGGTENRVPLSEIFSSVQKNRVGSRLTPSPAVNRSPTKAPTLPPVPTPPPQAKSNPTHPAQPHYPDLTQNLNSFPQYNTDSGYHGMPEDGDDMVLTQVAPESQLSTQPMDLEPVSPNDIPRRSSVDRRTTDASFHSAREEVRNRGETVEPMNIDSPKQNRETSTPRPEPAKEREPMPRPVAKDDFASKREPATVMVPESKSQNKDAPGKDMESSPAEAPGVPSPSPQKPNDEPVKDEMALDNLEDMGSPSDGYTPERPPFRKSSLSFASLPARAPLVSKSIGGSRLSRTSHIEPVKANTTGASNYFGRQTGHRMTQAVEEQAEIMEVDEVKETATGESDVDAKASKIHNKSSTQRLHEKISMLGKMQPSRPTKSIPAASGLSSAQVSYPELPATKTDTKLRSPDEKPRAATPLHSTTNSEDDWIKPPSSPFQAHPQESQLPDSKHKISGFVTSDPPGEHVPSANGKINEDASRTQIRQESESIRGKSATPIFSSPQRHGHQKSASVNIDNRITTTPVGSPSRQDGPLSASKSRLQSIVRTAKGLFTSSGGASAAARMEASSPDERKTRLQRANTDIALRSPRPLSVFSPPRQEGRQTRSSTEREEKHKQHELDERKREEDIAEKARQQEKLRSMQQQSRTESEVQAPVISSNIPSSPVRSRQAKPPKDPEPVVEASSKATTQPSVPQPSRQNDRRPAKPTREPQQKPKPQPVSIRVGSALSRQMPVAPVVSSAESNVPAPMPPPPATKPSTLKKKASSSSLHTASSNSSFKSSVSSQPQRKGQLASERKREQEEREARRKEEQRRELERKRAAQQQEEARRQEMRSRGETERRERLGDDPRKAAQMQAIEKRRLENARRLEKQSSQQPDTEKTASQPQREASATRPPSRLGSVLGRPINQPVPNPAKPPKRGLEEEASHRPATAKLGAMQPSGETKRRRTDDEQNRASMRPTMAPPIRQSNIRKEPAKKPSMYGTGQNSAAPQPSYSIAKPGQPQRPGHPMDMAKYASGKIPFAEPSSAAGPSQPHRTPGPSSTKATKPSPNYPNGENIHLPEIATDSEDEDSDAEMLPVPKWAQSKELEMLLRDQESMEADAIFGPIAPFSLEDTFKSDKKIKKFRERTSSANWAGPDGLTQDEIRRDIAERQRLRLNGGWSFEN